MTVFHGTKHNDTFNEASDTSSDTFDLYKGGEDTVIAGSGGDIINMGASLDAGDRLDGGAGTDILVLRGDYSAGVTLDDQTIQNIEAIRMRAGFDYNLTTADGNVAAGERLIVNARALGGLNHLIFDGSAETDGRFLVYGGAGNDTVTGGAKNDFFHLENGGNDTTHGGGGNDTFYLASTFTSADAIDGGTGNDTVVLAGMGDDAIGFTATTMTGVETLVLGAGHFYTLTTNDATVALGETLTIDATALGSGDPLIFNGSNETNGNFVFKFGSGFTTTDTLTGGAGNDTLALSGGDDILFGANQLSSIETLTLSRGGYDITTNDGNVAAGATLTVDASALTGTNALNFNASAETDGAFAITGGAGDDTFVMGQHIANVSQGGLNYTTTDTFNGGAGDDMLELNFSSAAVFLHFQANTITNIDTIKLDGTMSLYLDEGNVAAGETLTIWASVQLGNGSLVDGSAETDGAFHFIGEQSGGPDTFKGGAGDDLFDMGDNNGADTLTGNGGNDTFSFNARFNYVRNIVSGGSGSDTLELKGDYTTLALRGDATHITSVETLKFLGSHSYTGASITGDMADGSTLTIDASAASNISIDLSAATSAAYAITGSGGADTFKFGSNFSVSDSINGGAGSDTVTLNNFQGIYNFTATTIQNVETLTVGVQFDANAVITTNDGNVAAGATLTVDFSPTDSSGALNILFDGSAETDGHFAFIAPAESAAFSVFGGALSDSLTMLTQVGPTSTFNGLGGDDTLTATASGSTFVFNGGEDTDTLFLTGGGTILANNIKLTSVENMTLDDNTWNITTGDTAVGAGTTLIVDATALIGSHTLTFNGSGETDGSFGLKGSAGADTLIGGSQADNFLGGIGADTLTGHGGADTFFYTAAIQSTSTIHDTITDFAAGTDKLDLAAVVTGIYSASGSVSMATFDSDLAAIHPIQFEGATIVTVTGGGLNGHTLLVVDGNGDDIYTGGQDYVIDITGYTGTITTGDFI